jgi:protein-S-isoprenylcysteine O-methyltransferase Ste14
MLYAVVTMRRARTAVSLYKPSAAVVSGGPYRFSRNPVYLADALLHVGVALLMRSRSLLALLLLPLVVAVMNAGVIAGEERYPEGKFGAPRRTASCRRAPFKRAFGRLKSPPG